MQGKIALEEHVAIPDTLMDSAGFVPDSYWPELKERLLELVLEGKRWFDLVRFNKAFEIVPSLQGKQAQTHLLYFPIGVPTRTRETKVEETQGWQ